MDGAGGAGGCDGSGEDFIWRYTVECLGDAEKAQLIKPGAEGSAAAMALHYQQGAWSRFNWPMFRSVKGNTALRVQLRREGALPKAAYMRLLTGDDVEWQLKKPIAVTEDWQAVELTPDDVKFFRGADPEKVLPLSFDHVIQYHVLPASNRDGAGILVVDSLGFVPNGPVYIHDADEWKRPPEPAAMDTLACKTYANAISWSWHSWPAPANMSWLGRGSCKPFVNCGRRTPAQPGRAWPRQPRHGNSGQQRPASRRCSRP